ncbi:epimerase family protein SDR39U1-like [Tubulanus polymorphus]|uniref:epimerase family protein SDR39U1-like n=1 Tax=Tubulanus polymorphus TaxID=672921 RepID=UPI003DA2D49B
MASKILIGGGTGFIGRHLAQILRKSGYDVIAISRQPHGNSISWAQLDRQGLPPDCKAVINLAGQNLLDPLKRWNEQLKEEIYTSRVQTTETLTNAIIRSSNKPEVFISTSAVGYYEPSETAEYTEDSEGGNFDFLSMLCKDWEDAAKLPPNIGDVRQVTVRVGVVLGREGGVILRSYFPFFFGLGGRIGSGNQWFPWIHIADIAGIYQHAIENTNVSGILNGVAPNPVTNQQFTKAFAGAMSRPAFFPVPEFVMKAVFGADRARVILEGQKVLPKRTLESGYQFSYPDIQSACQEVSRFLLNYDFTNK